MTVGYLGVQITFEAAIVGPSLEYNHYYEVKAVIFGSDSDDKTLFNGTCEPNKCENGATCRIGLNGTFFCVCTQGFNGRKKIKKFEKIKINYRYLLKDLFAKTPILFVPLAIKGLQTKMVHQ